MQNQNIFISYAREDEQAAQRLYSELKQRGVEPWLDKESLLPGQIWRDEISKAIRNSRYFIAILSSNSVERRGYVQKELKEALDILDKLSQSKIFVIPVRLDECNVSHRKVNVLHIVDLFPNWRQGFEKVLKAMGMENVTKFNWTNLLFSIRDGKCTPFIGLEVCRPWIPGSKDVSTRWAQEYDYPLPDSDILSRVAEFLEIKQGDNVFPKEILSREIKRVQIPSFHRDEFRNMPPAVLADLNLPIYITTNYDHIIEEALKSRGKQPISDFCRWSEDLVEYGDQNEINDIIYKENSSFRPTSANPLVYHLHGDIDHPSSMVLTEKDYIDFVIFLNKEEFSKRVLPLLIRKPLNSKELLFVGYGLDAAGFSLDFSVIFQTIISSSGIAMKKKGISVQVMMPTTDSTNLNVLKVQKYLEDYTNKILNLNVYWGDPLTFSTELRRQLQGEY